ncbi:DUF6883 domain-containing protein [Aphanothece sacrum]|uniref:DUF6883 domain-containing protein n=1 Tax=Aphanothece sacrum FPU1 TaxID=1920663 RepID=A0A401IMX8_APHSA|nr:DUF6883 domain-containing protein [Aphanothece sacrum]GBF82603.1 hypothetical protein AsFPU1_4033 [Aphanothece sacrum FPU1]GBF84737.1 hypothetical protein AsFPU3_1791 [Aphanothece sacrum FPU3]
MPTLFNIKKFDDRMKLKNPEKAILGDKLERYCLNFQHSLGKHKALIFQKRLGITLTNKKILEDALLTAVRECEAMLYKQDSFGIHYDIKLFLETEFGSSWLLSSWIIRFEEDFPRLTNVYPVDK